MKYIVCFVSNYIDGAPHTKNIKHETHFLNSSKFVLFSTEAPWLIG